MKTNSAGKNATGIEALIRTIRGERVIMDADLARIYGVTTKRLNEQVKRNTRRFPPDFRFQLTRIEAKALWAQMATSNRDSNVLPVASAQERNLKSQNATSSSTHGGVRKLPYAFTEHGALMAANVLNSPRAVQMSVFVVRAFVKMRGLLADTRELAGKLAALESELKSRLDVHEAAIVDILQRVMKILDPPPPPPEPPRPEIGFHAVGQEGTDGGMRKAIRKRSPQDLETGTHP